MTTAFIDDDVCLPPGERLLQNRHSGHYLTLKADGDALGESTRDGATRWLFDQQSLRPSSCFKFMRVGAIGDCQHHRTGAGAADGKGDDNGAALPVVLTDHCVAGRVPIRLAHVGATSDGEAVKGDIYAIFLGRGAEPLALSCADGRLVGSREYVGSHHQQWCVVDAAPLMAVDPARPMLIRNGNSGLYLGVDSQRRQVVQKRRAEASLWTFHADGRVSTNVACSGGDHYHGHHHHHRQHHDDDSGRGDPHRVYILLPDGSEGAFVGCEDHDNAAKVTVRSSADDSSKNNNSESTGTAMRRTANSNRSTSANNNNRAVIFFDYTMFAFAVRGASREEGAQLIQYPYCGEANQQWAVIDGAMDEEEEEGCELGPSLQDAAAPPSPLAVPVVRASLAPLVCSAAPPARLVGKSSPSSPPSSHPPPSAPYKLRGGWALGASPSRSAEGGGGSRRGEALAEVHVESGQTELGGAPHPAVPTAFSAPPPTAASAPPPPQAPAPTATPVMATRAAPLSHDATQQQKMKKKGGGGGGSGIASFVSSIAQGLGRALSATTERRKGASSINGAATSSRAGSSYVSDDSAYTREVDPFSTVFGSATGISHAVEEAGEDTSSAPHTNKAASATTLQVEYARASLLMGMPLVSSFSARYAYADGKGSQPIGAGGFGSVFKVVARSSSTASFESSASSRVGGGGVPLPPQAEGGAVLVAKSIGERHLRTATGLGNLRREIENLSNLKSPFIIEYIEHFGVATVVNGEIPAMGSSNGSSGSGSGSGGGGSSTAASSTSSQPLPKLSAVYIIMEYADGGDLKAAIKAMKPSAAAAAAAAANGGTAVTAPDSAKTAPTPLSTTDNVTTPTAALPFADAMRYFVQILMGVRYLHSHCVVHRDLKPANLFLFTGASRRLKVGDFGLSFDTQSDPMVAKSFGGTAQYMAPEAVTADGTVESAEKADMWAVGVILYELLTSISPFEVGATIHQTLAAVVKGQYAPLPVSVPEALRALCGALLSKDPSQRPSAAAVLDENAYVRDVLMPLYGKGLAELGG